MKPAGYNTPIPAKILTPDQVVTRIGTLEFSDGFPTDATAQLLCDHLDFICGVEAFLHGVPAASLEAIRTGLEEVGITNCHQVGILDRLLDSAPLFLTGNTDTVYVMGLLVLYRDGPTVIEIPQGAKSARSPPQRQEGEPTMRGRERREDRREERQTFGVRGDAVRYQMREKLLSIGDDSWIEDDGGRRAFKVNGKALRVRQTLILEDADGNALLKIQDRPVRVRDVMEIEDADGRTVATVKKAMITPLRERFKIDLAAGGEMSAQGNIVDHEFEIEADGGKVAEVSKKWFRVRDSYGVEVSPGQNDILLLAITICIDQMAAG